MPLAAPASGGLLEIPEGISHIDLDEDGEDELVVKAWRDNFNAHGFYTISFYKEDENGRLTVLPFERSNGSFSDNIRTYSGAECWISDIRRYYGFGNSFLIFYQKDNHESMQDEVSVKASFYRLKENKEKLAGLPKWSFAKESEKLSKGKYCDVGEAIKAEEFVE